MKVWLWLVLACVSACSILYPAPTPIPSTYYATGPSAQDRALLLLLPGRSDTAADFDRQGFVQAARNSGAPIDLVAVDARFGYYIGKTLLRGCGVRGAVPEKYSGTQQTGVVKR